MFELSIAGDTALVAALIFLAALLYSSVGHAGASGYIAVMAMFGTAPAIMKPTALVLNILVATLSTIRWHRLKLVNWKALVPLLIASIPCAFMGGAIQLPAHWYRLMIGLILIVAALKFLLQPRVRAATVESDVSVPVAGGLISGGAVGLLSGLTGTGGGIFLSPILLFLGWANVRQASGITAPFILFNSIAGLLGNLVVLKSLPSQLPWLAAAALAGGIVGSSIGIQWASGTTLQRLLGVVLLIAGVKFIWI